MKIDINRKAESRPFIPSLIQDSTWIVVSDKKSARVFSKQGLELKLIKVLRHEQPVDTGLSNDTVGRGGAYGAGRHKYEPGMEESRQKEISFVQELAAFLKNEIVQENYNRLVIVAAPQTLGTIRKSLDKNVEEAIILTANKNFGSMEEPELKTELLKLIPGPTRE